MDEGFQSVERDRVTRFAKGASGHRLLRNADLRIGAVNHFANAPNRSCALRLVIRVGGSVQRLLPKQLERAKGRVAPREP